jgi:hypothetical protein
LDPVAPNVAVFDSITANTNDTTLCCYLSGCTDAYGSNYDAAACYDDGSCAYPACVAVYPYTEDFNTGSAANLSTVSGSQSSDVIDFTLNGAGDFSWHTTGHIFGHSFTSSATDGAYVFASNPDNVSSARLCLDLTSYAAGSGIIFSFDLTQNYSFGGYYKWFRVVDGANALVNTNGLDHIGVTSLTEGVTAVESYDLSAYAGQSVVLELQSVGKYSTYYNATYGGDDAFVDNINVASTTFGCMDSLACNYDASAVADNGSCFVLTATASSTGADSATASSSTGILAASLALISPAMLSLPTIIASAAILV